MFRIFQRFLALTIGRMKLPSSGLEKTEKGKYKLRRSGFKC